jgi:hypothetical protein
MMPGFKFAYSKVPPCPGTRWYRVEDEHPRWQLAELNGSYSRLVTDALIRNYGRRHLEAKILKDLPPLPPAAWDIIKQAEEIQ